MDGLLAILASMVGFGSLVAVVINVGKAVGFVKDGQTQKWLLGFNILGLALLLFQQTFFPGFDLTTLDKALGGIAQVVVIVLGLIGSFGGAKFAHFVLKGTPVIGKSFTLERQKRLMQSATYGAQG